MKLTKLFKLTLITSTLMFTVLNFELALAKPKRLHQVEILVFENNQQYQSTENPEEFDKDPGEPNIEHAMLLQGEEEFKGEEEFTILPAHLLKMANSYSKLDASGKYQIIYHKSWLQSFDDDNATNNVHLLGGRQYGDAESELNPKFEIEGLIKLKGKINFQASLDMLLRKQNPNYSPLYESGNEYEVFRIKEIRRVKNKELQYFDHPKFGILLIVHPYEAPKVEKKEESLS